MKIVLYVEQFLSLGLLLISQQQQFLAIHKLLGYHRSAKKWVQSFWLKNYKNKEQQYKWITFWWFHAIILKFK